MITCSVVVPVHNESENLEKFVVQFWNDLKELQKNVIEIHLVENGSEDDTYQKCQRLEKTLPNVVIAHTISNPSYGEAIKQGIVSSTGDVVCILECDIMDGAFLTTSLKIIEDNKVDFVIASKRHHDSIDRRSFKRRMLTFLFNLWLKLDFDFPGSDTHGLKAIRCDVAKSLCKIAITSGEIFQTELVLLAYWSRYKVIEVPVYIEEKRGTKISIYKRLPKIMKIKSELKKSLKHFYENKLT